MTRARDGRAAVAYLAVGAALSTYLGVSVVRVKRRAAAGRNLSSVEARFAAMSTRRVLVELTEIGLLWPTFAATAWYEARVARR